MTGDGGELLDWILGATRIIIRHEHTPFWILQKRTNQRKQGYPCASPCANTLSYYWLRRMAGALTGFRSQFFPSHSPSLCDNRHEKRRMFLPYTPAHSFSPRTMFQFWAYFEPNPILRSSRGPYASAAGFAPNTKGYRRSKALAPHLDQTKHLIKARWRRRAALRL